MQVSLQQAVRAGCPKTNRHKLPCQSKVPDLDAALLLAFSYHQDVGGLQIPAQSVCILIADHSRKALNREGNSQGMEDAAITYA